MNLVFVFTMLLQSLVDDNAVSAQIVIDALLAVEAQSSDGLAAVIAPDARMESVRRFKLRWCLTLFFVGICR